MKKIGTFLFILCGLAATSAFAQESKVVVIPLGGNQISGKQVFANGGFHDSSRLTDSDTYILSTADVSLPVDGTCVVTATGFVNAVDNGDTVTGPFFRTIRGEAGGDILLDDAIGSYAINVGSYASTPVSATYAWSMTADTVYNFGCVFSTRPFDWSDGTGRCRVTWTCTEN